MFSKVARVPPEPRKAPREHLERLSKGNGAHREGRGRQKGFRDTPFGVIPGPLGSEMACFLDFPGSFQNLRSPIFYDRNL